MNGKPNPVHKADVKIGSMYRAKVSGTIVTVTITEPCSYGGWFARNESTGKQVRIRSAAKLRRPVTAPETEVPRG